MSTTWLTILYLALGWIGGFLFAKLLGRNQKSIGIIKVAESEPDEPLHMFAELFVDVNEILEKDSVTFQVDSNIIRTRE